MFVSTAAGTITRLDADTGQPQWTFLAAPMVAELVVNGQLESRWPVWNSVVVDGVVYAAAGRHAEVDQGLWCWALDARTGAILHRFRIFQPITSLPAGAHSAVNDANRFRAQREIASTSLLLGGIAVNEEGRLALISRQWNKSGSRPSAAGYWRSFTRSENRNVYGQHDFAQPSQRLWPVDFAAWNGRLLDPIGAWNRAEGFKWRYQSPFQDNQP